MSLVQLVASDIQQAIERLELFHQRFAHYFSTKTRNMADTAMYCLFGNETKRPFNYVRVCP